MKKIFLIIGFLFSFAVCAADGDLIFIGGEPIKNQIGDREVLIQGIVISDVSKVMINNVVYRKGDYLFDGWRVSNINNNFVSFVGRGNKKIKLMAFDLNKKDTVNKQEE